MIIDFATANRIVFGRGILKNLIPEIAGMGKCIFLVTGNNPKRAEPLVAALVEEGKQVVCFSVSGEPTIESVLEGTKKARENKCQLVVTLGGGSVIDTGKAIAAMLTNPGDVLDYLEVIGSGKRLRQQPAPCIAIPTTAGTGSEVTRNAVLKSNSHKVKVSMRSPQMIPDLAIIDPELTYSMSPEVTASTGMDALTQLIEPFVSNQANPLTDGICREGIQRAALSLHQAYKNGNDADARENMALASLFGGLALANAKLGAVHGIAGPMGGMFPVPHGEVCARLLPPVLAANVAALEAREPGSPVLQRYNELGVLLTGNPEAGAHEAIGWIETLCADLQIPSLSRYGIMEKDLKKLVEKSQKASSMKGNPIVLTDEELYGVLRSVV